VKRKSAVKPLGLAIALTLFLTGLSYASGKVESGSQPGTSLYIVPLPKLAYSQSVDKLKADIVDLKSTLDIYITNGNALHTDIQTAIDVLDALNALATGLKGLDNAMGTASDLLAYAKDIPETAEKATQLDNKIEKIHPSVENADKKVGALNTKLTPLRTKLTSFNPNLEKAVKGAEAFRTAMLQYSQIIDEAQRCISSLPDGKAKDDLQAKLNQLSDKSDRAVVDLNNLLQAPIKAIKAADDEIQKKIAPLEAKLQQVQKDVNALLTKLNDILGPLQDLERTLNASVCTSFPYWNPLHPTHIHHYNVCMSVREAKQGIDEIKRLIEKIVGKTLYKFAEKFGVDKLAHDLEDKANSALKPILDKLHLDLDVNVPGLNGLDDLLAGLDNEFSVLSSDIDGISFPSDDPFNAIKSDIMDIGSLCQGAR
jgi:predicted  nucleic acid-binding Zn-ribbon protein